MPGPGYVTVEALDAAGMSRNILFWSSDGTTDGDLVAGQLPQQFVPVPPAAIPLTIGSGSTYSTGVITSAGFRSIGVGATLSEDGTLTVRRFLDAAGEILAADDFETDMTGGVAALANVFDGSVFAAFEVLITNLGVVVADLTATALLLGN